MKHISLMTTTVLCLLGLATWTSLEAQEAKATPAQKPTVFLNHIYVVLDAETYRAITKSEFVGKELGSFQTGTGRVDGGGYTGGYLYFEKTFLEFFEPAGSRDGKRKVGDAGINFSVDRLSELQLVFDALKKQPGADPRRRTRHIGPAGRQVAFSESVVSQDLSLLAPFTTWVQAYHPDYFKLHKLPIPESGELTREPFMNVLRERFGSGTNKDALAADVIGVTVALEPDEAQRLDRELAAFGYAKRKKTDAVEYAGPDVTLRVLPAAAPKRGYKVISVKIALRKEPKESSEHRFGARSVLKIHKDKTADWVFD